MYSVVGVNLSFAAEGSRDRCISGDVGERSLEEGVDVAMLFSVLIVVFKFMVHLVLANHRIWQTVLNGVLQTFL